jgi:hypothetical protein
VELDFLPNTLAKYSDPSAGVTEIPTVPSDMQHLKDQLLQMNLPELANDARHALVAAQLVLNRLNRKIDPLTDSIQQVARSAQITLDAATGVCRRHKETGYHQGPRSRSGCGIGGVGDGEREQAARLSQRHGWARGAHAGQSRGIVARSCGQRQFAARSHP